MVRAFGSDPNSLFKEIFPNIPESEYPMTTENPRGYVIMINNKFEGTELERKGADTEEKFLQSLFDQLNFKVKIYPNLKSVEMKKVLEEVAKDENLNKHDALIVFISSHGNSKGILGSSGSKEDVLPFTSVQDIFNNHNCTLLVSKPKMVFFSCCRGDKIDSGVKMNNNAMDSSGPSLLFLSDTIYNDSDRISSTTPTVSDMVFNLAQKYTNLWILYYLIHYISLDYMFLDR